MMDRRDLLRALRHCRCCGSIPDTAFAQFGATDSARLIAAVRKIGKVE
jgi:hypothetical protein